jgi:serine/threonine-protein kinase HipA
MFGAIDDSAPDRWRRALMRRMERRRAERQGGAPRTLQEIDFLLLVDDEARQGALRFAEKEGGPFLREEGVKRIPPLIQLPKLLSAAEHVMEEKDTEEELRMLFAPGSSLGGARPKASVREKDGHLAIAKFPRKDDEINTVVWEAVALSHYPSRRNLASPFPNPVSKTSPASLCSFCDASTATVNGVSRSSPR